MLTVTRRVITSTDEFVDPVATAHMYPMVLQPGAMRAELMTADLHGVIITTGAYSFPVATRGQTLADRIALVVPSHVISKAHVNGARVARGVAHAFGSDAEVAAAADGPVEFATISFAPELLSSTARARGIEIDLPGRGEHRRIPGPAPAGMQVLSAEVRRFASGTESPMVRVEDATACAHGLVGLAIDCFAADGGQNKLLSKARLNSVRVVRTCEDYAAARHYQGLTLADLCRVTDVSERRVRHAFYDCYGMSPTAYLRVSALNLVRHALLVEPPTSDAVTRAASDYGFWHLSRFAGQYRALFGETPSSTLAHRKRIAVG